MDDKSGRTLGYGRELKSVVSDDIDLRELCRVIWARRLLVIGIVVAAAAISAGVVSMLPNIYRADVLLAPVSDSLGDKNSSAMSQLGGLASLAGLSVGGSSSVEESLAVLNSRTFLWSFIQEKNLMPILFSPQWDASKKAWKVSDPKKQPNLWDAYRLLIKEGIISIEKEKKSDMVTLVVEWEDAESAAKWSNELVVRLNEYLRQQAIVRSQDNLRFLTSALEKTQIQEVRQTLFDLISQEQKKAMLATTQKEYAFKVLDAAATPDRKLKPKRLLIVLLTSLVAGVIASLYVALTGYGAKKY
jgi:uncharacterized protein involved in exopolysaccharide biosynthesis